MGFYLGTSIRPDAGGEVQVLDDSGGLFFKPSIELVWYPIRSLGLILEFGTMFEMVGGPDDHDLLLPPLLFLSLGLEAGI